MRKGALQQATLKCFKKLPRYCAVIDLPQAWLMPDDFIQRFESQRCNERLDRARVLSEYSDKIGFPLGRHCVGMTTRRKPIRQ